jgi:hypothetical protein
VGSRRKPVGGPNVALRTRAADMATQPVNWLPGSSRGFGHSERRNCQLFSAGTLAAKCGATCETLGIWLVLGGVVAL